MSENSPESEHDPKAVQSSVTGVRRVLYSVLAGLFLVLGGLGAILPGLPATPFLLLTSYFLLRTSPKLNERLLQSRLFGPILTDWQLRGGIRRDVKIRALAVVLIAVIVTLVFTNLAVWARVVIAVVAAIGITVVIRLPEVDRSNPSQSDTPADTHSSTEDP